MRESWPEARARTESAFPEWSQDASLVKRPAQSCAPHPGAPVPVRERGF